MLSDKCRPFFSRHTHTHKKKKKQARITQATDHTHRERSTCRSLLDHVVVGEGDVVDALIVHDNIFAKDPPYNAAGGQDML